MTVIKSFQLVKIGGGFFLEIQMNGFDLMSGEAYESRFA